MNAVSRRSVLAGVVALTAGCVGLGDAPPSEEELKERFNEPDALDVEDVSVGEAGVKVAYWTTDNDDSPPEAEMAAMVDVYRDVVDEDKGFNRLYASAYDPITEELEFEWHVLEAWLEKDDTMQRVNETRT